MKQLSPRCIRVNARYLRYGRKLPDKGGGACPVQYVLGTDTTCPGINYLGASYELAYGDYRSLPSMVPFLPASAVQFEIRSAVDVVGKGSQLSFKAMAPVFLVHGIRSGPAINTVAPNGTPLPDRFEPYRYVPHAPTYYQGAWFKQPFIDAKVPHMSIAHDEDLIDPGGQALANEIRQALKDYGAKYCHIVAHSMGGLWSRKALELEFPQGQNPGFGVYSLTTVATPHQGSYNAGFIQTLRDLADKRSFLTVPERLKLRLAPRSPGLPDLTPLKLSQFNASNGPLLPKYTTVGPITTKVEYFSVWGDANLNDSCAPGVEGPALSTPPLLTPPCPGSATPRISEYTSLSGPDESHGYEAPDPDIALYATTIDVAQKLYSGVYRFRDARIGPCRYLPWRLCLKEIPLDQVDFNDFQVSRNSARHEKFEEIGTFRHNHTTMGSADVSSAILQKIRQAEYLPILP